MSTPAEANRSGRGRADATDRAETRGRKRLLKPADILDAAVSLGLDNLRMGEVAAKLGVGTATLYQYFSNRKELVRAAAVHAMGEIDWPQDEGGPWYDLARRYAHTLATILSTNPAYLTGGQHSDYGFETNFRLIEPFLVALESRGFDARTAMEIFNVVGMAGLAGAVERLRAKEFIDRGDTAKAAIDRQYAKTDGADYPRVGRALDIFAQTPEQKTDALLSAALASFAQARGETITFDGAP